MSITSKEKKTIRSSKRGLTFSINSTKDFTPGAHYTYYVGDNQVIIKSCKEGKMKVSRKKSGKKIKALFDIRKKEVIKKLSKADYLEISINEDTIIVSLCKKCLSVGIRKDDRLYNISDILSMQRIETYEISAGLLASGCEYEQLSFNDCFSDIQMFGNDKAVLDKQMKAVYSVISLFSGAGMLDYPFHLDSDFSIKFACDYDKGAVETYRYNIGNHIHLGDIRNYSNLGECDVIIGGPSCKAVSNANRHTRLLDHPDYFLIKEYIRIVKESCPSVFVIENVPEFVTANDGELLLEVTNCLNEYKITVNYIKDCEVGGFTARKRVILIGSKIGSINLPSITCNSMKTVREALEKVDSTWFNYGDISKSREDTVKRMEYVRNGHNWEDVPLHMRGKSVHSSYMRRLDPDGVSPTLTNFRKTCLLPPVESPNPNRILSVAEASALSGFPKSFHFLGTLAERQQEVGNGVPFAIGKVIKNTIKRALRKAIPLTV